MKDKEAYFFRPGELVVLLGRIYIALAYQRGPTEEEDEKRVDDEGREEQSNGAEQEGVQFSAQELQAAGEAFVHAVVRDGRSYSDSLWEELMLVLGQLKMVAMPVDLMQEIDQLAARMKVGRFRGGK